MSHENRSKDEIYKKAQEIRSVPDQLEQVIHANAASAVVGRIVRRFFDDVYALTYSTEDLERRPFLNIGPGSFRHPMWRTADKKYGNEGEAWTEMRRGIKQDPVDYYWDIYSGQPMQEADGFFKVIYTSHVIEHLFPQDFSFLLKESLRLLEPGGKMRIVCPDAEQMATAYRARDWPYFMHYLVAKTGRLGTPLNRTNQKELRGIAAEFLLDWVSLVTNEANPTHFDRNGCIEFLAKYRNIYEAFDEATALSSRELNESVGGHVNWFNTKKLVALLQEAGFSRVSVSGYQKSSVAILRDGRFFDRTDPEMSIFVEAIK